MLVIVAAMIVIVTAAALTVAVVAYPMQGRRFEPSAQVDSWLVALAEGTGATDSTSTDEPPELYAARGTRMFANSSASHFGTTRD